MDLFFFLLSIVGVALYEKQAKKIVFSGTIAIIGSQYFFQHTPLKEIGAPIFAQKAFFINFFIILTTLSFISEHFEKSNINTLAARIIPCNRWGYFLLLVFTFTISIFLDNIVAALIGGNLAKKIMHNIGVQYIAAIVAAANAGGSGSVIGDTTTTMIWLSGVDGKSLLPAFLGAAAALLVFGIPAAIAQEKQENTKKYREEKQPLDPLRLLFVVIILLSLFINNMMSHHVKSDKALIGSLLILLLCLLTGLKKRVSQRRLFSNLSSHLLLMGFILNAHLLSIKNLPNPSTISTLFLGLLSAAIDNIPLTALAIQQKNYNWPLLAFSVGFGGSLLWFGSSAGIMLTHEMKKGRTRKGWCTWALTLSFFLGFFLIHVVTRT